MVSFFIYIDIFFFNSVFKRNETSHLPREFVTVVAKRMDAEERPDKVRRRAGVRA